MFHVNKLVCQCLDTTDKPGTTFVRPRYPGCSTNLLG